MTVNRYIRSNSDGLRKEWQDRLWEALKGTLDTTDAGDKDQVESLKKEERALYKEFVDKSPKQLDAYREVNRLCYWDAGKYELTLLVETAYPAREFMKSWQFELGEADAENLRLNSGRILDDICGQHVMRYNFAYAPYQRSSS